MVINETVQHHNLDIVSKRSRKRFGVCGVPGSYLELLNQDSALKMWLNELQSLTEIESLHALQAKSVASTPESFEAMSIRNAQIAIQQIRRNSSIVIDELDSLIDSLPVSAACLAHRTFPAFRVTYDQIYSVIETCRRKGCDQVYGHKQLSVDVMSICEQTLKFMSTFIARNSVNNAQIEANVRKLKENFGELVDATIKKECTLLVNSLNKKAGHLCLKWSLLALWQLTQKDPYMCRLFIENSQIVRALIEIQQNYCNVSLADMLQIKAAALRVLTYLCANREAIPQILDEIISKKCLSSIILDETDDVMLRESAGLLVQLTTPFIDCREDASDAVWNVTSKSLVNECAQCLTELLSSAHFHTSDRRIQLMIFATLANISFFNTDILTKSDRLSVMMDAFRRRRQDHVEDLLVKDQVITLLANVAQKHPLAVVASGGLMILLDALQHCAEMWPTETTIVENCDIAMARIQQKSAVALARLAAHRSTAKVIYKLNGVVKLVQLCKEARRRNFNDTVLLTSIAALKRLSQSIGRSPFKELNATDLIDLKLQYSFAKYRNVRRHESLV